MTNRISKLLLLPVLVLGWTASEALAQNGAASCTPGRLHGLYAFKSVGLLYKPQLALPNGDPPRIAAVGIVNFDGQGNISFLAGTNSFGGFIVPDPPAGFSGTYTLSANCTGTITFTDPFNIPESIYFVVAEAGARIFGLYTSPTGRDPGPVVTIDFARQ